MPNTNLAPFPELGTKNYRLRMHDLALRQTPQILEKNRAERAICCVHIQFFAYPKEFCIKLIATLFNKIELQKGNPNTS